MKALLILNFIIFPNLLFFAQKEKITASVWNADNGNGTYTNPILHSDYSDPDVVKAGDAYYMTASSFNCIPGLPILKSYDLVNWELTNYALKKNIPEELYNKVQPGKGVWAACIRFHDDYFYIFYPDPDFGIYMIKTKNPEGDWSQPVLMKPGKGLIDPSPLWDDNGKAYLAYAFAGSRAGIKSILMICTMNQEGTLANQDDVLLIDGHQEESTIEGPKIYKKNGFYYVFAPAGGVSTGWQTVLRSKNIFGPYEKRKVMDQGKTNINGPHQGAWVFTDSGEDWFIHFQDKGAFGRIVLLEPMKWKDNWPIIGNDFDNDGIGEPVSIFKKPNVGKTYAKISPPDSEEFNLPKLGLQWQWNANSQIVWGFPSSLGYFTLNCIPKPTDFKNLFDAPNAFLQKIPAPNFTATAKIDTYFKDETEEAGLVILGLDYSYLKIKKKGDQLIISQVICENADKHMTEKQIESVSLNSKTVYLRVKLTADGQSNFYVSENNLNFKKIGSGFHMKEGKWIGAKIGFVALRDSFTNDAGYVKLDWLRFDN
ncbi:glycoside hydrolase family 43 protein [Halpernia frigidisoli]|uniref:Beta-xylosidase n=1 Tax=Halpernia frigidisoli TaxID=1125876 RepID=A0A1I3IVX6_9FLAO|nr:glycoside hydrolase 43 family protein [Halpernia frigidisoli]SFI52089.1 Beta-xylosidase [Halpernia frigidisoli]